MTPSIIPGDYVIVNKPAYGARLFDLFDALEGKKVKIRRTPGYTHVKHNDVVVFHIPHPHGWDKIEMDMFKCYIKRCIGLPGDTLRIVNGIYSMNSDTIRHYGNFAAEQKLNRITQQELLPDELIIGKASFIWKFIDPYSHQIRWERFMKSIQ